MQIIIQITFLSSPFYGYHPKAHQFLKIYLYNPGLIRRVGSLLQSGAILGRVFQAHETHVPFVLQFMIDYNLYGMSSLHCPADHLRYRRSPNGKTPKIAAPYVKNVSFNFLLPQ